MVTHRCTVWPPVPKKSLIRVRREVSGRKWDSTDVESVGKILMCPPGWEGRGRRLFLTERLL